MALVNGLVSIIEGRISKQVNAKLDAAAMRTIRNALSHANVIATRIFTRLDNTLATFDSAISSGSDALKLLSQASALASGKNQQVGAIVPNP